MYVSDNFYVWKIDIMNKEIKKRVNLFHCWSGVLCAESLLKYRSWLIFWFWNKIYISWNIKCVFCYREQLFVIFVIFLISSVFDAMIVML